MFFQRNFDSCYKPAGAGANYAFLTVSVEDDVFHKPEKDCDVSLFTQWKQKFVKYTPHHQAIVVQNVQNAGAGKTMTAQLSKTPDLLGDSYTVSGWYGIKPNCECGVTKTSWVNAKALYVNKCMKLKVATQTLFEIDGQAQLIILEFMGVLPEYAASIGFYYTKDQLIEDSKYDVVHYAPWVGFPMQGRPDLAFAIGTVAFHPINFEQQNRSICELVVNYDGMNSKGRGINALPIEVNTGAVVSQYSVDFALATNCVWVSKLERCSLLDGYNEIIFKEFIKAGEHNEGPACNPKKVTFDLNVKGPTNYIWLTVQSCSDIANGNWVKTFDDYGLDYITEFMLITGTTAREDGMPASFYRTIKVIETFKVGIRRAIYVLSFETNDRCKQFTGHQTMTNCEKLQIQVLVKAHPCSLDFTAYAAVLNGVYTENGTAGKIWG